MLSVTLSASHPKQRLRRRSIPTVVPLFPSAHNYLKSFDIWRGLMETPRSFSFARVATDTEVHELYSWSSGASPFLEMPSKGALDRHPF
jgi:hypothetical protein